MTKSIRLLVVASLLELHTRILCQYLVNLACEDFRLDIQNIEVNLVHFIVSVFCLRVTTVDYRGAEPIKFATGHEASSWPRFRYFSLDYALPDSKGKRREILGHPRRVNR